MDWALMNSLEAEIVHLKKRVEQLEAKGQSPKRYRDVTAECDFGDGQQASHWRHNGVNIAHAQGGLVDGYRLTKISGPLTPHVAFIVEKEE